MTKLWLDLETYSAVPITHGTHEYASGVEILLFAWALNDGPVQVWDVTEQFTPPDDLRYAVYDEVWAHNSHFDRTVLRHDMPGLIVQDVTRWRDTMVQALCHALPGSLGQLSEILRLPVDQAKEKDGRRLINLFCKPPAANLKRPRATRLTHPEDWAKFKEYAALDIHSMRAAHKIMPMWNYRGAELDLWHLDQRINDRGVAIDLDLVRAAIDAVSTTQKELAERTVDLTDGQLTSTTKRNAMLDYIANEYGILAGDLQMATVERMLDSPDTPAELRALLDIRLQATTTSTSKYKTLLKATNADGRLRGVLQFNGAARTGRWAGRLFQPQNLKRSSLPAGQIELAIEALKAGALELICA